MGLQYKQDGFRLHFEGKSLVYDFLLNSYKKFEKE